MPRRSRSAPPTTWRRRLARPLPGAVHRRARAGSATSASSTCAADHRGDRRHRRRRRQAADGLRLPRADDELPGRRDVDDRTDRERDARRARSILRRDDRHPTARSTRSATARGRSSAARCASRRTPPRTSSASGTGPTTAQLGAYPLRDAAGDQVLPAGVTHRRRGRRPQPGLLLRAVGGLRARRLTSVPQVTAMADTPPHRTRSATSSPSSPARSPPSIRSFDQLRRGAEELMKGLENFNTTMENLNETAAADQPAAQRLRGTDQGDAAPADAHGEAGRRAVDAPGRRRSIRSSLGWPGSPTPSTRRC